MGELEPIIVQPDAQRKCPVSTFHPPSVQHVKDNLHGHRTNWQHPLLHGCGIKEISERERHVVLLIDEIYTVQRVEYQSGKLYGYESQQTTKTLLCFIV